MKTPRGAGRFPAELTAAAALEAAQTAVCFRPAVAEELPRVAHFADLVEIELGGDERVLVACGDVHDLAARIAEVALSIKLADVPRALIADAVDRADVVAVRHGVRGLLELPEILRQTGHGRGRIEHDLRAGEAELARALGEVAVVADVDADRADLGLEHRIAEVAGAEVELLPETGGDVRDVILAIFAEVRAVGVDHGGGVVVDAGRLLLIDRHHDDHVEAARVLLHQLRRRPVGDLLDRVVPARVLLGAEVRPGEDLLEADDLHTFLCSLLDVLQRALGLRFADLVDRLARIDRECGLNQTCFDDAGHGCLLSFGGREAKAYPTSNQTSRP